MHGPVAEGTAVGMKALPFVFVSFCQGSEVVELMSLNHERNCYFVSEVLIAFGTKK